MLSIETRLRLLLGQRPLSAARILAETLRHERGADAIPIAGAALRNGHAHAVAAVVQQLHRLPDLDRRLPSISRLHLSDALRRVIARGSSRGSQNAIDVIATRADPSLAHLLPPLLRSRENAVAAAAAAALLRLTVLVVGSDGRRLAAPAEHRDLLDEALAQAAAGFRTHKRKEALLAAALCVTRPGPRLAALLDDRESAAAMSLRAVPGWMEQPLVTRNLLRWLGAPAWRRAVSSWLPRLPRADLSTLLHDGHLLRTPGRRAALRQIDPALALAPKPGTLADLPLPVQPHLPLFISHLNLSPRVRVERLAAGAECPSPIARWRALEGLEAESANRARGAVREFCRDEQAAIARIAVHRLRRWNELTADDEETLMESGHASLAIASVARRAREDVLLFRDRFEAMSAPARLAAARRLHIAERGGLLTILHEMIRDERRPRRQIEVMNLVRRLELVPALEHGLSELTAAADVQVAATAVACLGHGRSRPGLDAVRAALRHPNHRIIANAVEALGRIAPPQALDAARDLTRSTANRVRGNAVRIMLRHAVEPGVSELRKMLRDEWPLHRISAIWVARRARNRTVVDDLRRLSHENHHPEVQGRAAGALRFLSGTRAAASVEAKSGVSGVSGRHLIDGDDPVPESEGTSSEAMHDERSSRTRRLTP